jgi:hypothetical protein
MTELRVLAELSREQLKGRWFLKFWIGSKRHNFDGGDGKGAVGTDPER